MKYIAVLNQEGGCDYTIGCGVRVIEFDADDATDARVKLKEIVREDYNDDEVRLSTIAFYPTSNVKHIVNVNEWYEDFQVELNKLVEENVRKKELAELERLQDKYGFIKQSPR